MTGQVNSTGHSAAAAATGATAGHPHPRAGAAGEEIAFTALMDRLVVQAEAGDVGAMVELGARHAGLKVKGFSIPKEERDFAQAIEWLTKAANAGNVKAMYILGGSFRDGKISGNQADPAKRDFAQAIEWLTKAANAGNVKAMFSLGALYHHGKVSGNQADPAKRDYAQEIEWLTKAANAGNIKAMYILGALYHHGKVSGNQADPAKRDFAQALYWFRKYSINKPAKGIARIRTLSGISKQLKVYHLLCVASPNFMAPGALDAITREPKLKLIIKGLCQYEDNRLTPQDQRFEMLKTIIDKDEKYFDHVMALMPVQEKDLFQNYLMRQKKVQLRYKVISSIVGIIPDQGHGLVPELKTGSVHQKMRTEDYVVMVANLRVEMAENARTQVLSRNDGDGVMTLSQVLATRMQNKIVEDILRKCLESIQGVLLYNPQDENLLGAQALFFNKLAALLEAKVEAVLGAKRGREEDDASAAAAAADSADGSAPACC